MASTKDVLRQLSQLFTPSSSSTTSNPFPSLDLPASLAASIDSHLSQFAASFPLGGGGGHQRDTESSRERATWREGLLELWSIVEPLPGTEGEPRIIAAVSAFLSLLEKLSAGLGDDDDCALVARRDIGTVWWGAVLRRTVLGVAKSGTTTVGGARGRKPTVAKKERVVGKDGAEKVLVRPLTVSRVAMVAVVKMVVWGMMQAGDAVDHSEELMTPFGLVVVSEYEQRAVAMLRGHDEAYGVRNLEECIIGWGERFPKAFFLHISSFITPTGASRLPFLSLLLAFLSRHSAKAYHALKTPLLKAVTTLCLLSPSPASVTVAIKCIAIFLVTLPVIIGDHLVGIMAVYGRVVNWQKLSEVGEQVRAEELGDEDLPISEELFEGPPPDPLPLFTVLYGIYPCNFTAFLTDPTAYLVGKGWKGPRGDGVIALDSVMVKDRSKPLIRRHTLHPSLISSDLATELTDTNRWRRLESADVMAECDRNVIQSFDVPDWRGETPVATTPTTPTTPTALELPAMEERRSRSTRVAQIRDMDDMSGPRRIDVDSDEEERSLHGAFESTSRSRSPTPHMPATTHFTNFQALQSSSPRPSRPFVYPSSLARGESYTSTTGESHAPSITTSRRSSYILSDSLASLPPKSLSNLTESTSTIAKLEADLVLLQAEVNFGAYLKGLHLAHMGTVHREKVLESGAEAERQSLYRTIRTLRSQLTSTRSSLFQLRTESTTTKANWIAHIDELKSKLSSLREARVSWEMESGTLKATVERLRDEAGKRGKELEEMGASYFDLQNQVTVDKSKLDRIEEYEKRLSALTKTLTICDEDRIMFVQQRKESQVLVGRWKKTMLLLESSEAEVVHLRDTLSRKEEELARLNSHPSSTPAPPSWPTTPSDLTSLRLELDRLRARNMELEISNADLLSQTSVE